MSIRSILCMTVMVSWLAIAANAQELTVFKDPQQGPHEQLTNYLNNIGLKQLAKRRQEIAEIKTRDQMEQRKKVVRDKILRLIGGLPDYRGPLNTKQAGTLDRGDYRIEKIIYESLPNFYVPANVYVPAQGSGPFPAVLMPVGHSALGKEGERTTAISLARKGFVVLKYDPIGQGERLQYYDPELRASKVGGPTTEHSEANGHTVLIGDNVARYRIFDGMRGIDYLVSRKDVDASRIGCTGCSGGGTLTTYISALDDRVKVAAPACYITSWEELLVQLGPQDAEQSFPRFLIEGLNIADYVELFAPKPWLSLSTINDFFPLEGARQTYEEAKRIYGLYGAEDHAGWFIGPGGHGVPTPSREAIYAWFIKWLKDGKGDPHEQPADLDPPENIQCTKTGQVSDSLGGETVYSINKKRAADLIPAKQPVSNSTDLENLRSRLVRDVRNVAAISIQPGGAPPDLKIHDSIWRDSYTLQVVSFAPEKGLEVPGVLLVPDAAVMKPAVVAVDPRPRQMVLGPNSDLAGLAKAGYVVLAIEPRGLPETGGRESRSIIGDQTMSALATAVGKTLVGMRAEDIIHAVDYLASRKDVDSTRIMGFGEGPLAVSLLHAAVIDNRIGRLILQNPLTLYRLAVDRPIHRNIYEVDLPGVLKKYDLDDLLLALSPRTVTVINPVDALGVSTGLEEYRKLCHYTFEADAKLGHPKRVNVVYRGRREPLEQYLR